MRMLPIDKGMVGAFNDKIEFHPRARSPTTAISSRARSASSTSGIRRALFDALDQSMDQLDGVDGRKAILVFTDGDDNVEQEERGRASLERARTEEVMIYSIGLENELLQRPAAGPQPSRRQPAAPVRGNRRRLLPAQEKGRSRPDVHARRAGAAQPVRPRLLARDARRQDPQARSAGQEAGCHPPLAQELCGEPGDGHGHGEVTFVWQLNFSCQGSV